MKLTKYEHACFTVEENDQLLVVDPGNMTSDFIAPEHIVGIVITHKHGDHFDKEQIQAIIDKNPEALIISVHEVLTQLETPRTQLAEPGQILEVGPFELKFFGGKHAQMHADLPIDENIGVMINDLIYFPGDSFTIPDVSVDTLVLPVAAPWLKFSETMDYLRAVKPRFALPTHDRILSDSGKGLVDMMLSSVAKEADIEYKRLDASIEI